MPKRFCFGYTVVYHGKEAHYLSECTDAENKNAGAYHASQSVAHVEKFIFGSGYTAERVIHDYGYDLNLSIAVDRADAAFWQTEIMPVVLIVYDARQEEAYWLYVQEALEASNPLQRAQGRSNRFYLLKDNVVHEAAIERFRRMKQIVQEQLEGKVKRYG